MTVDLDEFQEYYPKHRTEVVLVLGSTKFDKDGNKILTYKCPYHKCTFRTYEVVTKEEQQRNTEILKDNLKDKFTKEQLQIRILAIL
jgi:hypothetical protein